MSQITTIDFDHTTDDGEDCIDKDIEVVLDREPDDPNYGADADGNRGIFVAGYWYTETAAPDKCATCGHVYTDEERKEIEEAMNRAAETYEWEPDYD